MINKNNAAPVVIIAAAVTLALKFGSGPRLEPIACGSRIEPDRDTVVMLAASWCRYCNRARALFIENNVSYCEYDIERSDIGAELYERSGVQAVPIIYVRDKVIIGYDRHQIMRTLMTANLMSNHGP